MGREEVRKLEEWRRGSEGKWGSEREVMRWKGREEILNPPPSGEGAFRFN